MLVLLTGSLGSVGSATDHELTGLGHDVVGADLRAGADYQVDCTDPVALDRVVGEVLPDAVVHLATMPGESSLPEALTSHAVSTAAVLEAMLAHGVRRIAFASSNHAVGRTPRPTGSDPVPVGTRPRPDMFYGVGKVAAEAVLSLYTDRHGLDAVACRIGSFLPRPTTRRHLSTWLSPGDCGRMFEAAISAPRPGFAVLFGISANTRAWWDLEPGRALGYHPQDDAEAFAAEIEAEPETDEDRFEAGVVGGAYAGPRYDRPAFG